MAAVTEKVTASYLFQLIPRARPGPRYTPAMAPAAPDSARVCAGASAIAPPRGNTLIGRQRRTVFDVLHLNRTLAGRGARSVPIEKRLVVRLM